MSLIKLYKNCDILPNKNFEVDDIAVYLNTKYPLAGAVKGRMEIDKCQWAKHQLELTYKLQLSEYDLEFNQEDNWNYMSVQNTSGGFINPTKIVYYFIINKKWISSECIEFTLKMDVLNTFKGDYTLSPKTTILRQHKDRWADGSDEGIYKPLIDFYTEGIPSVLFKKEEHTLYETLQDGQVEGSFYLIYRNKEIPSAESPNPAVDILLCGDSPIPVNISALGGYTGILSWSDLDNRLTYGGDLVIYKNDTPNNNALRITITYYVNRRTKQTITFAFTGNNNCIVLRHRYCAIGVADSNGFTPTTAIEYKWWVNKDFDDFTVENLRCARQMPTSTSLSNITPTFISNQHSVSKIDNYLGEHGTINPISSVDRTDPKLLKIIKLPYRPVEYDIDQSGEMIRLPTGWSFNDGYSDFPDMLIFTGTTTSALQKRLILDPDDVWDTEYVSPFEVARNKSIPSMAKTLVEKSMQYETKLLHSDYYSAKFVYDSFTFDYNLEYLDTSDLTAQSLWVDFYVSLTMSSKFMFKQGAYLSFLQVDNQNYSGIVYVARNNELPIFNSEYINYIKVGYNYDIKTRNRQLTSSIILGTIQLGGAVVSAVAGATTGNPIGVAGAVGLGVSAITTYTRTAFATAQADQNIAQKLKQAEMQGVSVSGADDVDIMTEYTNDNKAKIVVYEVSEKMKKCLYDIFYYCGYIANFQDVPDLTSRLLFNYVQADIVFATTTNFTKEIADEIVNKYKEGMTRIHHYTLQNGQGATIRGWDFEQQYENWETSLL